MEFRLVIDCDNAAFEVDPLNSGDNELSRILRKVATTLGNPLALAQGAHTYSEGFSGTIRDVNGNRVGSWTLK